MTKERIMAVFQDINMMYNNPNMYDGLSQMLDELIESSDKWIPVTERLPGMGKTVLVTNDGDEYFEKYGEGFKGKHVTIAYMTEDGWVFSDMDYDCQFICITAWQPLPKSYKGE